MSTQFINELNSLRGHVTPGATIIAIGGGKGGIGKSFISSGLAIFLSQLGHDTYLVDLDLGAANLHTCLGESIAAQGINEFIHDPNLTLQDVAHPTRFPHLKLISGASDILGVANLTEPQKARLMSSIYHLKGGYVILDLSAGTSDLTLDFFLMASRKVVVFTPEPSSMENAYRFMKTAFYRKLRRYEFQLHLQNTINDIMRDRSKLGVRWPADLIRVVSQQDQIRGAQLRQVLSSLNFDIILNQCRSLKDVELGPSIQSISHKYFGVPTGYLGYVEYDNAVWQSLRKRRHLLIEYPHSRIYAQLMGISRRLMNPQTKQAVV